MLGSAVLEKGAEQYPTQEVTSGISDIPYEISCEEGVTLEENCFTVNEKKAKAVIRFDGEADSETYFKITNLDYQGKSETAALNITCQDQAKNTVKKKLQYFTNRYRRYAGKKDFLINLNYSENKKTQIEITFPEKGTYSFDSIQILCQNMSEYVSQIEARKESVLEDVNMTVNQIEGSISLDQDKILCLSLPYTKGWTAYVDGKKQEIKKANLMYMALDLTKGDHQITWIYHTPYLRIGACISAGGILILVLMIWYRKKQICHKR